MDRGERDDRLDEILAVGRQTRKRPSRGLWIAALIVGALGVAGFAVAMLSEPAPASEVPHLPRQPSAQDGGGGLGIGLWIVAGAGIAIAVAISRQRASHSSRNSP